MVIEAQSLIDVRLNAALEAVETGADFAEGHELEAALAALVPPEQLKRMVSSKFAANRARQQSA